MLIKTISTCTTRRLRNFGVPHALTFPYLGGASKMPPQRPVCTGRLVYAIRRRHDSNVPGIWPSPSVSNDYAALHRLAHNECASGRNCFQILTNHYHCLLEFIKWICSFPTPCSCQSSLDAPLYPWYIHITMHHHCVITPTTITPRVITLPQARYSTIAKRVFGNSITLWLCNNLRIKI